MLSLGLRGVGGCSRAVLQRRHQSSFRQKLLGDSSSKQNVVIYGIIGANVAVFGGWQLAERDYALRAYMQNNFTVSSQGVFRQGKYWTLLTSVFSHKDSMHLLFNGMAFYSFGMNSIALLGANRFLLLYMGGGLLSSLAQVAWPYVIPRDWPAYHNYSPYSAGLGASGEQLPLCPYVLMSCTPVSYTMRCYTLQP
jgi:membrane associated rhomboid family serine protease